MTHEINEALDTAIEEYETACKDLPVNVAAAKRATQIERRRERVRAEARGDIDTADMFAAMEIADRQGARVLLRWAERFVATEGK